MIKPILMFCAEGIVLDRDTNNVSVYNILEDLSSPGFPLFIQKSFIFYLLERTPDDPAQINTILQIRNNEEEIMRFPVRIDFQDLLRSRSIVTLQGLTIPNPGVLRYTVLYEENELSSYNIRVNRIGEPQVEIQGQ